MPDFMPYMRFTFDHVLPELAKEIYSVVGSLEITAWRTPEPVPFAERQSGEKRVLKVGDAWGGLFDCAWFNFKGEIPASAAGQPVVLLLDVNGEMLVVDELGNPLRGLTNVSSDYDYSLGGPGKRVLPLNPRAQGGEKVDVWVDAGANDLFGRLQENGKIKEASIAVCHETARALYYDYEVLYDFFKGLPEDSVRYQQIQRVLMEVVWILESDRSGESVEKARAMLKPMLEKQGGDPSLNITAIGHAHMDLGWLWPTRETKRKGARTFATALANMDLYPYYLFGASQPQLFQWVKEDYPALYERVKQKVKEGRFEVQGAMWVEADTNISGGEALVRQLLLGKRFFKQEFGVEIRHLWLPDVFGYSGALPQILKLAGVDYFMTQKMSWNQINHFPHHSFHWCGIDGTAVLTHMLPEETYNSPALPRGVAKIEKNYPEKGVSDQCLMLFGIGDGGGGPGEEHIERLGRIRNLAGLSPVKPGMAADFFEVWKKDADRFPTWVGELYLEKHSGTLTTEAKNKWFNRHIEQALRELEWTAMLAGGDYPAARLDEIWREVLLYQFHDILPGSSIKRVYDESVARYTGLLAEVEDAIRQNQTQLASQINTVGMVAPTVLFNSCSWDRTEWVNIDGAWKRVTVPACGYLAVDMASMENVPLLAARPDHLENDQLRVLFAVDGSIRSIYDKAAGREALVDGQPGNRLRVYQDHGDAWDFLLDYASQTPALMALVSSEPLLDGPRAVLKQTYHYGHSVLVQEISLTAGGRRLEFDNRLAWREKATMLRTSFPIAVHAAEAAYEIQFGHIRRPTHRNTTWDLAKDEVAAHKWADLSQHDFGVALLNDSKYGYKIKDNVIDLNLLRSVPYPGPELVRDEDVKPGEPHGGYTDQADHVFRYAIYPHAGDAVTGGVPQAGYEFNLPLRLIPTRPHAGTRPAASSLLDLNVSNVIVEAVKQAEDDSAMIVRLYESAHASAKALIHFSFTPKKVEETNLMEETLRELALDNNAVFLEFHPFEIKTLKVTL